MRILQLAEKLSFSGKKATIPESATFRQCAGEAHSRDTLAGRGESNEAQTEAVEEGEVTENRWSMGAATTGAVVACLLAVTSDVSLSGFWSLLSPFAVIVFGLCDRFHFQIPALALIVVVILNIFANAIWFMVIAETLRLLRLRFSR
jgi:hypothetical protein